VDEGLGSALHLIQRQPKPSPGGWPKEPQIRRVIRVVIDVAQL
jgi:hypothetical protein